ALSARGMVMGGGGARSRGWKKDDDESGGRAAPPPLREAALTFNSRMRIVFIGTGEIGVPTLRALLNSEHEVVAVVTQPDKPVGREHRIEPPPIKKTLMSGPPGGRAFPFPIFQPAKIKDQQAIEEIRALTLDLIVVVAYGQILPRAVLEIPRLASLNLHASLL